MVHKQRQTIKFLDPFYAFLSGGSLFFFSEETRSQKKSAILTPEKFSDQSEDEE
jgi:hypothetical protein